jgi:zinc transporter
VNTTPNAPVGAFVLDAPTPKRLTWDEIRDLDDGAGALWVHLDRTDPTSQRWVRSLGLDPLVVSGLLDENTRPRITRVGNGLLATLRGVNLNPGADPTDLIALRIWAAPGRVLTLHMFRLASVRSVIETWRA